MSKPVTNETLELFSYYNENLGGYIQPKSSILLECKLSNAVSIVLKHLRNMPNYSKYRQNSEFILRACTLIENLGIKKSDKVSKKDVFVQVFKELFDKITDAELESINSVVQFLLDKKLVKHIRFTKKVVRFVKNNALPTFLW